MFVVAADWFFASHFLNRARAAQKAGWQVWLLTRAGDAAEALRAEGIEVVDVPFERASLGVFSELATLLRLLAAYRRIRPDLVHHVALKPVVYGSIAARLAGVRGVVNAPVGMGFVFASEAPLARLLRPVLRLLLRLALRNTTGRVIFENPDDQAEFIRAGVVKPEASVLIRGAGVELEHFRPVPEPEGTVRVLLVARMVPEKGVREFVAAARLLRERGLRAEFWLVGAPDPASRSTLTEAELRVMDAEGAVRWLGNRSNIPELLAEAHIVCLPSYREGLPKALLEALAAGRAVVATDVPGCREAVRPGLNGLLVPPRDALALAEALATVIQDREMRIRFGAEGRRLAETCFASEIVCRQTLSVYESLCKTAPTSSGGSGRSAIRSSSA